MRSLDMIRKGKREVRKKKLPLDVMSMHRLGSPLSIVSPLAILGNISHAKPPNLTRQAISLDIHTASTALETLHDQAAVVARLMDQESDTLPRTVTHLNLTRMMAPGARPEHVFRPHPKA